MWSDKETDKDFLAFNIHANLLCNVIVNEKNLPVTIGLYGDWGSGKSSVLKLLQKSIEKDEQLKDETIVIYFDGWAFESFDDAKLSLIHGIVEGIYKSRSWSDELKAGIDTAYEKAKEAVFSLRSLAWGVKNVIIPGGVALATGGASLPGAILKFAEENKDKLSFEAIQSFIEDVKNENRFEKDYKAVHEFRKDFKELIKSTHAKRVVVLIDDLDRCLPEHIIDNLEAIKLFLNVEKTAFVIAADKSIVSGAIQNIYSKNVLSDKEDIGRNYMEKFIQLPYNLPELSDNETTSYITLLFAQSQLTAEYFDTLYEDYQNHLKNDKFRAYDSNIIADHFREKQFDNVTQVAGFVSQFSSMLSTSLRRNPRLIKRFLNAYELRCQLLEANGIKEQTSKFALLKLMLLEQMNVELFKEMHSWCFQTNTIPDEILTLEKYANKGEGSLPSQVWNDANVLSLFEAAPLFSSVNLKELYWVSRDNVVNSMGGMSLIPIRLKELCSSITRKNLTDNVIAAFCKDTVSLFKAEDLKDFYTLLDNKILTAPNEKPSYNLYYHMIMADIDGSYDRFLSILKRIKFEEAILFSLSDKFKDLLNKFNNDQELINLIKKNTALNNAIFKADK